MDPAQCTTINSTIFPSLFELRLQIPELELWEVKLEGQDNGISMKDFWLALWILEMSFLFILVQSQRHTHTFSFHTTTSIGRMYHSATCALHRIIQYCTRNKIQARQSKPPKMYFCFIQGEYNELITQTENSVLFQEVKLVLNGNG